MASSDDKKVSRREALQKLSQLAVYSAPTVVTLLSAQLSHAQTSEAYNNNQIVNMNNFNACIMGHISDLVQMAGGVDMGGNRFNDTIGDCMVE